MGAGAEYRVAHSLTLIVERYGQKGAEQAWQAGPRFHLGPLIDVDVVVGRSLVAERAQWLTTGATVAFLGVTPSQGWRPSGGTR